jgi:hypothetical protein
VTREYVACYAFGKRRAPMAPLGLEGTTTVHVWATWVFLARLYPCAAKRYRAGNLSLHLVRLLAQAANDAGNRPPAPVNFPARR